MAASFALESTGGSLLGLNCAQDGAALAYEATAKRRLASSVCMRPTWKVESSEYMRLRLYFEEFGQIYVPLLENDTLVQQAMSNSKEQFANSPDLKDALMHAIMDAFDAHTPHDDEHPGARLRAGPRWSHGHPLGSGAVVRSLTGAL